MENPKQTENTAHHHQAIIFIDPSSSTTPRANHQQRFSNIQGANHYADILVAIDSFESRIYHDSRWRSRFNLTCMPVSGGASELRRRTPVRLRPSNNNTDPNTLDIIFDINIVTFDKSVDESHAYPLRRVLQAWPPPSQPRLPLNALNVSRRQTSQLRVHPFFNSLLSSLSLTIFVG